MIQSWRCNMKRAVILFTFLTLFCIAVVPPAEASSKAAVLYLRIAAGARPAGMGEAFVALADDATATYWNPAGLGNSPLSGVQKTKDSPNQSITSAVTLERLQGGMETWVIDGGHLYMLSGESWSSGTYYQTSSDQALTDLIQTVITVDDSLKLRQIAQKIVLANCQITPEQIEAFTTALLTHTPADYPARTELEKGVADLKARYEGGLLVAERFSEMEKRFAEDLQDSVLTAQETDRFTYSLERASLQFLPTRVLIPFEASLTGKPTCLGKTGNYLWVGTEDGLYRLSGMRWARFSTLDSLPSDTITALSNYDETVLIGTTRGMVKFAQGKITLFPELPAVPVSAITFKTANYAYAVVDDRLFMFDGASWADSYPYTVRIDDGIDGLTERSGLYRTFAEYEFLIKKIDELNQAADPTSAESSQPAADSAVSPEMPATSAPSTVRPWLSEGKVIRLPLSPKIRYAATTMMVDPSGTLWLGTAAGLLSYSGNTWTRYGYQPFIVPPGDSTAPGTAMTAWDVAARLFPSSDSAKTSLLAANIDGYNDLNGGAVEPGQTVHVYSSNTGSAINSIGFVNGELLVGTEYGLLKYKDGYWEPFDMEGLDQRAVLASYDYEDRGYYVASNGVTTETSGRKFEFTLMHVKWLPVLDQDMYYEFASFVHHVRGLGTFGGSIIFLTYGSIGFTDETGNPIGEGSPFDITGCISFGTSLSNRLKGGVSAKVIHSRLSDIGAGSEKGSGIATAFAFDLGAIFKVTRRLQLGAVVVNIGPNITYIDAAQADPLPRNLGFGVAYRVLESAYNKLTILGEVNRELIKFDDGVSRDLTLHAGAEYWYANLIALRTGYKHDRDGQVKHLTFGLGIQFMPFRIDFAYIPRSTDSPLANTLRTSVTGIF